MVYRAIFLTTHEFFKKYLCIECLYLLVCLQMYNISNTINIFMKLETTFFFSFWQWLNICFSTTIMYLKNKRTPSDITGKLAEHILCFKLLFVRLHMANQWYRQENKSKVLRWIQQYPLDSPLRRVFSERWMFVPLLALPLGKIHQKC